MNLQRMPFTNVGLSIFDRLSCAASDWQKGPSVLTYEDVIYSVELSCSLPEEHN